MFASLVTDEWTDEPTGWEHDASSQSTLSDYNKLLSWYCCRNINVAKNFKTDAWIEKIVIVGMQWKPEHTTLRLNSGNDSCRCSYRTM